eukprot:355771_1
MKDIIGHLMPNLAIECKTLPPYIKCLLDYHMNNLPRIIDLDFRDLSHQYEWVQSIFVKEKNVPYISNAFNLFVVCKHIRMQMPDIELFDDYCSQLIINDATNIHNNEVKIEFVWNKLTYEVQLQVVQQLLNEWATKCSALILNTDIDSNKPSISMRISKNTQITESKNNTDKNTITHTKNYDA